MLCTKELYMSTCRGEHVRQLLHEYVEDRSCNVEGETRVAWGHAEVLPVAALDAKGSQHVPAALLCREVQTFHPKIRRSLLVDFLTESVKSLRKGIPDPVAGGVAEAILYLPPSLSELSPSPLEDLPLRLQHMLDCTDRHHLTLHRAADGTCQHLHGICQGLVPHDGPSNSGGSMTGHFGEGPEGEGVGRAVEGLVHEGVHRPAVGLVEHRERAGEDGTSDLPVWIVRRCHKLNETLVCRRRRLVLLLPDKLDQVAEGEGGVAGVEGLARPDFEWQPLG
mmetsp:Transcript_3224/g.7779  ORF Transcript_3224/g.7779 Transcript_3224/m.7779 type:complete len:279 (-) Transcript_3224:168-1004(-)